jgi:hypothetical protein
LGWLAGRACAGWSQRGDWSEAGAISFVSFLTDGPGAPASPARVEHSSPRGKTAYRLAALVMRSNRVLTARADTGLVGRVVTCRLPASESRTYGTDFLLLRLTSGAAPRSDVERTAGMFRGGALCGPSLFERLLRRLLSELLGFLRALHLSSFLIAERW